MCNHHWTAVCWLCVALDKYLLWCLHRCLRFTYICSSPVSAAVIGTRLHMAVALSCLSMAFYVIFLKWWSHPIMQTLCELCTPSGQEVLGWVRQTLPPSGQFGESLLTKPWFVWSPWFVLLTSFLKPISPHTEKNITFRFTHSCWFLSEHSFPFNDEYRKRAWPEDCQSGQRFWPDERRARNSVQDSKLDYSCKYWLYHSPYDMVSHLST